MSAITDTMISPYESGRNTVQVKDLVNRFTDEAPFGMLGKRPVKKIDTSDISNGYLTPTQRKVVGVALIILAIGLSVIPFAMPLTLGVAIALNISASVIWYSGSFLYRNGADAITAEKKALEMYDSKNYYYAPEIESESSRMKKVVGLVIVLGAIALGLIPYLKEVSLTVSALINGGAFLASSLGAYLYNKEFYYDEIYRATKMRLSEIHEQENVPNFNAP